jgi:hypothetical protein
MLESYLKADESFSIHSTALGREFLLQAAHSQMFLLFFEKNKHNCLQKATIFIYLRIID